MRAKQDSLARRITGGFILGVFAVICLYSAPDRRIRPEPAKADLDVTAVDFIPFPPRIGLSMVTIKITVMNRGSRATSAPCALTMSIFSVDASGNKVAGDQIPPNAAPPIVLIIPILEPGKAVPIFKSGYLHWPGRHCVTGVINTERLGRGEEISSNNDFRVYFDVLEPQRPANLVLEAIELTPDGRMKLSMRNAGAAIPDADFNASNLVVWINDKYYCSRLLKSIDPQGMLKIGIGRNIGLRYIWPAEGSGRILLQPGQSMKFQVILDENKRILDSNRADNEKTVILARRS